MTKFNKPGVGDDIDLQIYKPEPGDVDTAIVIGRRKFDQASITSGYAPKYFVYNLEFSGLLKNRLHFSTHMEAPVYKAFDATGLAQLFTDEDDYLAYSTFDANNALWRINNPTYWTLSDYDSYIIEQITYGGETVRYAKIYGPATVATAGSGIPIPEIDTKDFYFSFHFRKHTSYEIKRSDIKSITVEIKDNNNHILCIATHDVSSMEYMFTHIIHTAFTCDTTTLPNNNLEITITFSGIEEQHPCYSIGNLHVWPVVRTESKNTLTDSSSIYSFGNNIFVGRHFAASTNNVLGIDTNGLIDSTDADSNIKPYIGKFLSPSLNQFIELSNEIEAKTKVASRVNVVPLLNAQNTSLGPTNGISPTLPSYDIAHRQYGNIINSFGYVFYDDILKGPGAYLLEFVMSFYIPNNNNIWSRCTVDGNDFVIEINGETITIADGTTDYKYVDLYFDDFDAEQQTWRKNGQYRSSLVYVERWIKISGQGITESNRLFECTAYIFGNYSSMNPPNIDTLSDTSIISSWEALSTHIIKTSEIDQKRDILLLSNNSTRLWVGIHIKTRLHGSLAGYDVALLDDPGVEFDGVETRPSFYFGKGDGYTTQNSRNYSVAPVYPNDISVYNIGFNKKQFVTTGYTTNNIQCLSNGETQRFELVGFTPTSITRQWYSTPVIKFKLNQIGNRIQPAIVLYPYTFNVSVAMTVTSKTLSAHVNWPDYESAGTYKPYFASLSEIFGNSTATLILAAYPDTILIDPTPFTVSDTRGNDGYVLDVFNITNDNDPLFLSGGDGDYIDAISEFYHYCDESIWAGLPGYVAGYPPTFTDPNDVLLYSMTRIPTGHEDYGHARVVLPTATNNFIFSIRSDYTTTWCPSIIPGNGAYYGLAEEGTLTVPPDTYVGDYYYGMENPVGFSKYVPGSGVVNYLIQNANMGYTNEWCLYANIHVPIFDGTKLLEYTISPYQILTLILDDELTDSWADGVQTPVVGNDISWIGETEESINMSNIMSHSNVLLVDLEDQEITLNGAQQF